MYMNHCIYENLFNFKEIDVKPFRFEGSGNEHVICNVALEVDFLQKKT